MCCDFFVTTLVKSGEGCRVVNETLLLWSVQAGIFPMRDEVRLLFVDYFNKGLMPSEAMRTYQHKLQTEGVEAGGKAEDILPSPPVPTAASGALPVPGVEE